MKFDRPPTLLALSIYCCVCCAGGNWPIMCFFYLSLLLKAWKLLDGP